MRKAYIYLTSFFLLITVFSLCYYYSFQRMVKQSEYKNSSISSPISKSDNDSINTDSSKKTVLVTSAKYTLELYDVDKKSTITNDYSLPEEFIGQNREQVVQYLKNASLQISDEDKANGFVSIELEDFSKDRIIVRKVFDSSKINYEYYIIVKDGNLVVYDKDKRNIIDETDIQFESLSTQDQKQIMDGLYMANQEELYGTLESYSS